MSGLVVEGAWRVILPCMVARGFTVERSPLR